MKPCSLREIDLNLLVILDVLLQEMSVSGAAHRLHLTPSAVSHALKRLRELFDDELLVRDGRRMSPTVRAQEIAEILPMALRHVANVLTSPDPFQPATSTRVFRMAAPDFVAPLVLSEVMRSAPRVRVEWLPTSPVAVRELSHGHCDALIAPSVVRHEGLRAEPMGEWEWRVYGRAGHPAFLDWSLRAWSAHPHLQIGTGVTLGQGPIDKRVAELGVERRIGAVVPHFSMAASVVANTNLLLTVPSLTMAATQTRFGLEQQEVPFDLPRVSLSLFRSAMNGDEPGLRWFLERIQAACRAL